MEHFVASILERSPVILLTVVGGVAILPLLSWLLSPSHDPREPPLIKPRIPFIGHIISLIRFQNEFHPVLHKANPSIPIASIPMLNGKIYTVFDPYLIQSTLRSKAASFDPFVVEFAQKTFGLTNATFAKITSQPKLVPQFTECIHQSFQPASLQRMNVHFLRSLSSKLELIGGEYFQTDQTNSGQERSIETGLEVDNLYLWCRDVMTLASTQALYGDHDPFRKDPTLIPAVWTYEKSVPFFLLSLFPAITIPKGFQARKTLQDTMTQYYESEYDLNDDTASRLVANRAGTLRMFGFTSQEIAKLECILPMIATTNAVPTFFWMLIFVLSRPKLVTRLRAEAEAAATFTVDAKLGNKTASFDVARFEEQLPLMTSCYRETMRLVNHSVSMRRAVSDITLVGQDGQTYLLKKGNDIQLSAGVTHGAPGIWGSDAADFDAERFLKSTNRETEAPPITENNAESKRIQKAAFFPFGGGKHLCPGRNLAFSEILGFMSMILLRFDVEASGMRFEDLKMEGSKLSAPSCKPAKDGQGLGAKITARKDWEKTAFAFKC